MKDFLKEALTVDWPTYYVSENGVELDEFIAKMPFYRASAIKYVYRAGRKNQETELEDLRKARKCIDKAIKLLEEEY